MALDDRVLDTLFRQARTHYHWADAAVTDDELCHVFDLTRMGLTSANSSPARFLFLRTPEVKQRLHPAPRSPRFEFDEVCRLL